VQSSNKAASGFSSQTALALDVVLQSGKRGSTDWMISAGAIPSDRTRCKALFSWVKHIASDQELLDLRGDDLAASKILAVKLLNTLVDVVKDLFSLANLDKSTAFKQQRCDPKRMTIGWLSDRLGHLKKKMKDDKSLPNRLFHLDPEKVVNAYLEKNAPGTSKDA